jgi:hypothetical protein
VHRSLKVVVGATAVILILVACAAVAIHHRHQNDDVALYKGYPTVGSVESALVSVGKMGGLAKASARCPSTFARHRGTTFDCVVSGTNHHGEARSLSVPVTLDAAPGFGYPDYRFN